MIKTSTAARLFRIVLPGCLLIGATATAQSTIVVPDDQPSIQAGINAALTGDTVLVLPGTYTEHSISFGGRAITVVSSGGPEVTTVQAGCVNGVRSFRFESGEGRDSVLQGFTITRADCPTTYPTGGIYIDGASPTIADCRLVENGPWSDPYFASPPDGGAIHMRNSSAAVRGCLFLRNSAGTAPGSPYVGGHGGAVFIYDAGSVEITDCEFLWNAAGPPHTAFNDLIEGGRGGAISVWTGTVAITRCVFSRNRAGDGDFGIGLGGAVHLEDGNLTITSSVFEGNMAGQNIQDRNSFGDAVFGFTLLPFASIDIDNCTFVNNGPVGASGSQLLIEARSVRNSIVWSNASNAINATVTYSNVEGGHAGIGNIDADPMVTLDYHLAAGSPCVDAGDPDTSGLPPTDFEGQPRVIGAAVDMGADEHTPAMVTPYGCGVNPAGSISVLAGAPALDTPLVLGIDNPLGTQAPGSLVLLVLSTDPDPSFPCGTLMPGFGMAAPGYQGELLLDLAVSAAAIQNALWAGPGIPAPALLPIPDMPELIGITLNVQGAIVDLSPGAFPVFGITDALELTIGL